MRKVMVKAWEIARKGQSKFGGKVSEYLSAALKMAWALVKKGAEKVKELPTIVAKRAEELFDSGDQPTMQYAENKAKHEFNGLIKNLEKMNAVKEEKGQKTMDLDDFKNHLDKLSVKQYREVMMTANHAVSHLK